MVLESMTPLEKENWIKINQLIYLVKKSIFNNAEINISGKNAMFDYLSSLSRRKLNEFHQKYINDINKETWVECYPYYFHFSEFIIKLNDQVSVYLENNQQPSKLKKRLLKFQKKQFKGFSLELLIGIFWLTNDITF